MVDPRLLDLARLESESKIPPLTTESPYQQGRIVSEILGERFDPSKVNEYRQLLSDARTELAHIRQLEAEKRAKVKQDGIEKTKAEIVYPMLKKFYRLKARNGFTCDLDDTVRFGDLQTKISTLVVGMSKETIEKLNKGEDCPKRNQKIDLKGCLDRFAEEIAQDIVEGRLKTLTQIELYRRTQKLDPVRVRCGEEEGTPGLRCLGVLSEGLTKCFVEDLVLTER